jgi:hypothetical protein
MTTTKSPSTAQPSASRFERDWGRVIGPVGYTQVPEVLLVNHRRIGLSTLDLVVVLVIMRHWRPGKPCWVAKTTLAAIVGVTPRAVQRRIAAMDKKGLLRRTERKHRYGDSDTNLYDLPAASRRAAGALREEDGRGASHPAPSW